MPRISREAAAAKESFVLGLFATNPALTNKEVQDAVKQRFGGAMNANRVNDLRERATGTTPQSSPIVTSQSTETIVTSQSTETIVEPVTVANPTPDTEQTFSVAQETAPAPEVAAAPDKTIEKVEPVLTTFEQVTDANGTHLRNPTDDTRPRKTIVSGLEEVVVQ